MSIPSWVDQAIVECRADIERGLDHSLHNAPGRVAVARSALDRLENVARRMRQPTSLTHDDIRNLFDRYLKEYGSDGYGPDDFVDFVVSAIFARLADDCPIGIDLLLQVYERKVTAIKLKWLLCPICNQPRADGKMTCGNIDCIDKLSADVLRVTQRRPKTRDQLGDCDDLAAWRPKP